MSRLTWRSRSVLAAGAAAVLVGAGVAALAATTSSPDDAATAAPAPAPQPATDDRAAELRRSVDDLMGQVDALESSLAGMPTPDPSAIAAAPVGRGVDDNGGDRPAGVSDDARDDDDRYDGDDHDGDDHDGDDHDSDDDGESGSDDD